MYEIIQAKTRAQNKIEAYPAAGGLRFFGSEIYERDHFVITLIIST